MVKNKTNLIIAILAVLVLILGLLVVYSYFAKPYISGYVVNAQNQGIEVAVVTIMQRAATCQTVPLTYKEQTINLIAVECLQQAVANAQQSSQEIPVSQENTSQQ